MQNQNEITLGVLVQMLDRVDAKLDKLDSKVEDRTFTLAEKEELLIMVRHYNQWLEEETLGGRRITLTRDEYDAIQKTIGFPHRFSA